MKINLFVTESFKFGNKTVKLLLFGDNSGERSLATNPFSKKGSKLRLTVKVVAL